jgi:threonine dehydrogenase-like Zn-dependent dehydrogenase
MVVNDNHVLGHESSGQVVAVHPSVTSLRVGDRVAIEPNKVRTTHADCYHLAMFESTQGVFERAIPDISNGFAM